MKLSTMGTIRNILAVVVGLCAFAPAAHATTLYVENNGVDGAGCGAKPSPCRSISRAIANAVAGDKIIVGPGLYSLETPSAGCGCRLSVNKPVILVSSDGAASTVIDAEIQDVDKNVLIITDGAEFGRPGQGFTVTGTFRDSGDGIVIDSNNVKVRGNQVVAPKSLPASISGTSPGSGIFTVNSPGIILIDGNQVIGGWSIGISTSGSGKTVSNNQVSLAFVGITHDGTTGAGSIVSNILTGNGIIVSGAASVVGNATYGGEGIKVASPFTGTIQKNNMVGNTPCGLTNQGVVGLDVAHNYWGAATGPGPDPADNICNTSGGSTTWTPFATHPFPVSAPIKP